MKQIYDVTDLSLKEVIRELEWLRVCVRFKIKERVLAIVENREV